MNRRRGLAVLVAFALGGCATVSTPPRGETRAPSPTRTASTSTRPVDPQQAQRLQRVMVPLIRAMNNPVPLERVKVGIVDDGKINAANAGRGEFYVTRGLLEKANDIQLAGVLAHEVAHEDLRHVAKAQALGTGLQIGMVLLDQLIPGSGAITPIAGQLIARGYSRTEEYAADRHGAELLQRVGVPPEQMVNTLVWLMQTEGSSPGGFFSTHPATDDRIEALRQYVARR